MTMHLCFFYFQNKWPDLQLSKGVCDGMVGTYSGILLDDMDSFSIHFPYDCGNDMTINSFCDTCNDILRRFRLGQAQGQFRRAVFGGDYNEYLPPCCEGLTGDAVLRLGLITFGSNGVRKTAVQDSPHWLSRSPRQTALISLLSDLNLVLANTFETDPQFGIANRGVRVLRTWTKRKIRG